MPLSFPPREHVPLRNSPLREVICQVRFPLILRIANEAPITFQEAIRDRFPNLETEHAMLVELSIEKMRPAALQPPTFRFTDKSKTRIVSLSLDFFSFSVNQYTGWDAFASDLQYVADAAISVYRIPYATRIGLRYINALTNDNTKSSQFFPDVVDIVQPEITALLRNEAIQDPYIAISQLRVRHDDSHFSFRSGILEEEDQPQSFLLDFDLYIEGEITIDASGLLELCDRYHALIYNAFRWAIKSEKLRIFEPVE